MLRALLATLIAAAMFVVAGLGAAWAQPNESTERMLDTAIAIVVEERDPSVVDIFFTGAYTIVKDENTLHLQVAICLPDEVFTPGVVITNWWFRTSYQKASMRVFPAAFVIERERGHTDSLCEIFWLTTDLPKEFATMRIPEESLVGVEVRTGFEATYIVQEDTGWGDFFYRQPTAGSAHFIAVR